MTDPRTRAEASGTNNLTATAGQTVFTVTPDSGSVSTIKTVTVEGNTKTKWVDYYWDYQNSKITFFTALSLNDAVVITFKYGSSNWIFPDKPDDKLTATKYPRISIFSVSGSGTRLGQYEAPVEGSIVLQIDIWTKENYIATIDSRKYSNNYLGRYLGNQITKAFEDNESDMFPLLYGYTPISIPKEAPYSEDQQAYHTIVEVNLKGIKLGRIEIT